MNTSDDHCNYEIIVALNGGQGWWEDQTAMCPSNIPMKRKMKLLVEILTVKNHEILNYF